MADHEREEERTHDPIREDLENLSNDDLGAPPNTSGAAPGGASTKLRHASGYPDMLGGEAGLQSGGVLAVGAGGGSGTGSGGLGTGIGGAGGTRNIPHGAGLPAGAPGTSPGADMAGKD